MRILIASNTAAVIIAIIVTTATQYNNNNVASAFSFVANFPSVASSSSALKMTSTSSPTTTEDAQLDESQEDSATTNLKGFLKRERYVAMNRFAVRSGKEAKFEQRWATRKSRLATLDGFKYFHLMRRVTLNDDGGGSTYDAGRAEDETNKANYVSFTVWQKKSDFSAWRNGDAFKEAHGGTSIGAFVSTMINSALVLKGPPRPAFYDGLLVQTTVPTSLPPTVNGWRDVPDEQANGKTVLPAECFVACNQFYVSQQNGAEFEKRWADRVSKLKDCDGFVAFSMLRRDGQVKGHGTVPMDKTEPTYLSTTIWKDLDSFDKWRKGTAFKQAHGGSSPAPPSAKDKSPESNGPPKPPLWSKPPSPVFYEGTLVISSENGV